jgi:hypothetical protein
MQRYNAETAPLLQEPLLDLHFHFTSMVSLDNQRIAASQHLFFGFFPCNLFFDSCKYHQIKSVCIE